MKFEQYLNGMVELKMPAGRTEEILQLITDEGIRVYQVRRQKEETVLSVHLDDFFAVRSLLRNHKCRFHIQKRNGLPFVFSRLKRRRGLWLGICTGFALLYLLLSFIWGYEVSGNVQYSDKHLIALVQEYGMLPGVRSDKFDYDKLAKQIVLDHPEFTWIQLKPDGTTLHIAVKERLQDTGGIQKTGSLVARISGRITELLVFRGTALVERGDWVTKGQVLVGGWDYSDRIRNENGEFEPAGEPFSVEAHAVISGEQERRVVGTCALQEKALIATGRNQTQISLLWNGHQFRIWGPNTVPYRYAGQETTQRSLIAWKEFQLPVYVKRTVFFEKKLQQNQYTEKEAYAIAVERARKRLQEQMPDGSRFLHESIGIVRTTQANFVQAEVVWLVEEPLAEKQQITLPSVVQYAEERTENNRNEDTQAAGG